MGLGICINKFLASRYVAHSTNGYCTVSMFVKCLVAGVGNIHTYVCGVQASLTTQLESGDWRKEP